MITQFITVILRRSRLPAKAFICLIAFPEAPALATAATHHRTCTKIESVLIIPTALSFRKAQNKCSFKHTSGLYSSSLRQISFWSHTNYSLAESRMFGPCRRLFVCLFCTALQANFVFWVSCRHWTYSKMKRLWGMVQNIYSISFKRVSREETWALLCATFKFSMQFFSLQTCPIMPNPKQVLLCPKKPMSSSRTQQTSSQRFHTPHTAPTLLTLLAELGGHWRLEICETTS